MTDKKSKNDQMKHDTRKIQPYRVRLPGFVSNQDIGLGDVIKHATSAIGIQPCGGCEERAALLNRWLVFSPGHRR